MERNPMEALFNLVRQSSASEQVRTWGKPTDTRTIATPQDQRFSARARAYIEESTPYQNLKHAITTPVRQATDLYDIARGEATQEQADRFVSTIAEGLQGMGGVVKTAGKAHNATGRTFNERLSIQDVHARDSRPGDRASVRSYGIPLTAQEAQAAKDAGFKNYQVMHAEVGGDVAPIELAYPYRLSVHEKLLAREKGYGPELTPDQIVLYNKLMSDESRLQNAFAQSAESPFK